MLIYPTSPRPAIEEVISVAVLTYPRDPRPAVVDAKLLERTAVER